VNALVIRCPTCNAALNVRGDATSVTCNYCHSPCQIQQRTRVFQIPRPVQGPPQLPVAQVPVNRMPMVIVGATVSMIVFGAMSGYFAYRRAIVAPILARSAVAERPATAAEAAAAARPSRPENLQWNSNRPLLRDLDGDGANDLVGLIGVYTGERMSHLAAYSGADGHALWRSPAIPAALGSRPRLALAGDRALLSGDDGKLYSYQLSDGRAGWTLELGEKVRSLCALPDDGAVRVVTEDDRARDVQLASGEAAEVRGKSRRQLYKACDELPTDHDNTYGQVRYNPFHRLPNVSGMYSRFTVRRGDRTLLSGGKSPGTGIPMVARLDGRAVKWRAELPSSNPLTSQIAEEVIYFDDRVALATYATEFSGGETRLVALSFEDGHRLWEAKLSSGPGSNVMSSVFASGNRAYVVSWTYLMAFDLKTGKLAFKIGSY
jgi:PQQ-like domain